MSNTHGSAKHRRFCGANATEEASRHGLRRRIRPLKEVMRYRNEAVVRKFMERFDFSHAEANELFCEVKRWLWLNARANVEPGAPSIPVTQHLVALDEMWHTFVLFTREYDAFCRRYLGHFIHHAPTTYRERRAYEARRRRPGFREEEQAKLEHYVNYICDQLGERIFLRWYTGFARRYSAARLEKRRRAL